MGHPMTDTSVRTYHVIIEGQFKVSMAREPRIDDNCKPAKAKPNVFNVFAYRKQNVSSAKPSQAKPIQKSKPKFGVIRL